MPRAPLPVDAILPELLAHLRRAGAVVLRSPTGAGKTTRVPPAILDAGLAEGGRVLLLEPRRVAARAAARRMANEHGSALGETFGYHVRFERRFNARTRVLAVTPGMLLRQLHDDPFLETVSCVVFDEFHERGLESDLALGTVKLLRQTVRADLRVVVLSATIDPVPISAYLGDCPVVVSEGRTFPVEVTYRPRRADVPATTAAADAVNELIDRTTGGVLVFLPGLREIRQTASLLEPLERRGIAVLPLHGDLPPEQQDRALLPLSASERGPGGEVFRKVVLATNVAETSVTVEGITAVVDTGTARQLEFDTNTGMDRLRIVPISRAAADQRTGRAGRTQAGICVRLWDEMGHRSRPEQTEPEIRRIDLAGAVLQLHGFGETDLSAFPWFEPPRAEAIPQAERLLTQLGAMIHGKLTGLGEQLAKLPVHPRVGRLLIEGARLGIPERAALAAALLSERDPFVREDGGWRRPTTATTSDVLDRVEALEAFQREGRTQFPLGELHRGGAKQLLEVQRQLLRIVGSPFAPRTDSVRGANGVPSDEALRRSIFAAYPDRLARRRGAGDSRARMVGGRGVKLAPQSGVTESALFVCVDVEAGGVESAVRSASGVERDWLPAEMLRSTNEVLFDESTEKLVARKQLRYGDLVIEDVAGHIADETRAAEVLAEAARQRWDKAKPSEDSAAGRFLLRIACFRGWFPDIEFPEIILQKLLPDLCGGLRSLEAVKNGPWLDRVKAEIPYPLLQRLEREVPDALTVPTGSVIPLVYEVGRPPILAVRIQEIFGLLETPRIARGRVKVLLHLLAPNHRPQQVTDDLASFWATGYAVVKKELRMKYPKHSWPDDPTTAEPIRDPKRRG